MPRLKTAKKGQALERFLSEARAEGQSRRPWRYRVKPRNVKKLTNQEKLARKQRRSDEKSLYTEKILAVQAMIFDEATKIREECGKYTVKQIVDDIYQTHRLKIRAKRSGMWNAFTSLEMAKINEGKQNLFRYYSFFIESISRYKERLSNHITEIAKKWATMNEEERMEATKDHIDVLEENRVNREIGHHNTSLAAFHDSRLTLDGCEEALMRLAMCTGNESILITVRSDLSHFNAPRIVVSSNRVVEFFSLAFKMGPDELGKRMEGYMLSGIEGVVTSYAQQLQNEKAKLAQLILDKLQQCAGKTKVSRMLYTNFGERITAPFGIILKNWPPGIKFVCPSSLTTGADVRLLTASFQNDNTHFYKMTASEYAEWSRNPNRFHEAERQTQVVEEQPRSENDPTSDAANATPTSQSIVPSESVTADTSAPSDSTATSSTTATFVNSFAVRAEDGTGVAYVQKKRKKCSDANKPRGPRKKRAVAADVTNTSSA
ncbi:hypothetical protein F5878DRAFT_549720 [Lentinula raphanica]|uniref:Uncharacterized protein n=1 Tax=Lentinula raphanica TaxID=153919 RepID=A0AA38NVB0_9AGAR|nr:hypothetical protein F5878DRAFT_549720 [Lentinula raphanica]